MKKQKNKEKEIHAFRNNQHGSFRGYSYLDEKYYSLNVSHLPKTDYQTIEFRLFGGTVNFREIKERIYWTLTFVRDCLEGE